MNYLATANEIQLFILSNCILHVRNVKKKFGGSGGTTFSLGAGERGINYVEKGGNK